MSTDPRIITTPEQKGQKGPSSSNPTPSSGIAVVISGPLGEVIAVANNQAVIKISSVSTSAASNIKIGESLVLESPNYAVVGEVSSLAMGDTATGTESRATITLLASLHPKTGKLTPGVIEPPTLKGRAYRPHPSVIRAVIEDRSTVIDEQSGELLLSLARPLQNPDIELSFSPEKILGRHCAVLGTSGSGKSWSTARLIEEIAHHKSKVVLLDPTGEYEPLSGKVFHVHLGTSFRANVKSLEASLPYRDLTEADLIAIFRPTSGTQVLKLRTAIRTLKMLQIEPKLAADGYMIKAHKPKLIFEDTLAAFKRELDDPKNKFDITKLPLQIDFECIDPIRSQAETTCWGGLNQEEQSECVGLVNRANDIIGAEELSCIFKPTNQPSVFSVIERFFADPEVSVLRISFEFLPTSHRVREIVANSLARYLLKCGRAGDFKQLPLVVFLDEAHQSINTQLSDMSTEFPLEAFNIIAKEGRKYGLTLCLATQRPRDIPEDVLSQVGTFLVHRLVNHGDRTTVERASGAASITLLDNLPSLGPGELFFMGIDFPTPLRVRMIAPLHPPRSAGPDYQTFWKNK